VTVVAHAGAGNRIGTFDIQLVGSMFQVKSTVAQHVTEDTFWYDSWLNSTTNGGSTFVDPDGDPTSGDEYWETYGPALTTNQARYDSHLLISSTWVTASQGNPGEEYATAGTVLGAGANAQFKSWMGNSPQSSNNGRMSIGLATSVRAQDLPFVFLVLRNTQPVYLTGDIVYDIGPSFATSGVTTWASGSPFVIQAPEPASMAMLCLGALGLVLRRRRRA
jgi:hypothetical protein